MINDKYSKAAVEIKRAEEEAKLSLASEFAGNIATIFGEQTAIGKAAAIAATTIETYKGATSAYASLAPIPIVGPILGIAAAGAAVASGLANVKKILSVKSGLPGDSSGGAGVSISAGSSTTATPAVTTVNPEIGKGIVSRDISDISKEVSQEQQKILVIDEVTANQTIKSKQNKTATV